jgi:hypothetical protein
VGIVSHSSATTGSIEVNVVVGDHLEWLHDVLITTPTNGQVLKYDSTSGLWVNGTDVAPVTSVAGRTGAVTLAVADVSGAAPLASPALTGNVTITSNSTGAALFIEQAGTGNILTLHDQASDTNFVAIDQNGKVNTVPAVTTGAGFNIPHGTTPTSGFVNGDIWTTTSGLFARINGSSNQIMDLTTTQTVAGSKTFTNANQTLGNSTAAGTINVASGATISGATKTINIGTNGVAGSTTNITVGSVSGGTTASTIYGSINALGTSISLGSSTTTGGTYSIGSAAIASGSTKAIQIGTNGQAGSTTNVAIGSTTGTSTTTLQGITNGVTQSAGDSSLKLATTAFVTTADNLKANIASPSLTGTPLSTTAAADTNTTQIATTAYVVGQAGSATPLVDGTAAVGTSLRFARQDHVHPTDTSRAALASPTFTGVPAAPTAAVDTNTTQLATTAYVVGQGYLKSATASSTYAPLASAALTGVPTAPTATPGTNTTQIATTAYVTAAVPAFATLTEARQFSNTTKVLSPSLALWSMFSADIIYIQRSNFTVTNVGSVQYTNLGAIATETRLASAAASSSRARTFGAGQVDQSQSMTVRANPTSHLNFSRPTYLGGRSHTYNITDTVLTMAFYYGKAEADGVGNLTRRGMGWKVTGGTGSRFLTLEVHNGTTLTSVTSSYAVVGGTAFDWDIIADGTGNVTLYVNGASVATSSAGPTGTHNLTPVLWQEEYSTSGAPAITFHTAYHSRGRMAVINY